MTIRPLPTVTLIAALLISAGGRGQTIPPGQSASTPVPGSEETGAVPLGFEPTTPAKIVQLLEPSDIGWDEMVEQRTIRALVARDRTNFFLDGGRQRGLAAEALYRLEVMLNEKLGFRSRPLNIAAIPVPRDQLISYLEQGRGDIAVGHLTITPERLRRVDFSGPVQTDVAEVVVTGPGGPTLRRLDDLAGQRVRVRPTSSYHESLSELNASFRERGLEEVLIVSADENLATEDLLEMVNAGLIRITIADDYLARFWSQIWPDLLVHEDLVVGSGRDIAWAIRQSATGVKEQLDPLIRQFRRGSLLGNMWFRDYLQNTRWVRNALAEEDRQRFRGMVELFRKYGAKYDFDYLMLAALAYQESGLDQSARSRVGAVGVMQVMPATAADRAVGIADIDQLEPNIHAGTRYLRHLVNVYFNDPGIDEVNRVYFAFASYNAGPNRINRLRTEASAIGLDPNQWFGHVELVVERRVGREPVRYVGNIYKYYVAYRLLEEQEERRRRAIGETPPDED